MYSFPKGGQSTLELSFSRDAWISSNSIQKISYLRNVREKVEITERRPERIHIGMVYTKTVVQTLCTVTDVHSSCVLTNS